MPNMWMDVDTALSEVPVNIVPLTDDTDFVSVEEGVVYNAAGMDLYWHFTTTAGATTVTSVTPTTAGDYDWAHQDHGKYTIEIPASGGASINNDTEGFGHFTGFATGVLPWVGPTVGFRAAELNNILVDATDSSQMPATQSQVNNIGSGATGGTHVEATFDNTTQDTIDNAAAVDKGGGLVGIPVTGHAFVAGREVTIAGTTNYNGAFEVISQTTNEVVITDTFVSETFGGTETIVSSIKGVVFVGTVTSGTFADVSAEQGDLHSMDDVGDVIDIVYGFNVGGSRQATLIAVFANVNGNTDQMMLEAYDFVGDAFVAKKLIPGSGGTSFLELDPELISNNTGTGTEIGDVFVRFNTVTTTPSSLDVDKCLLTAVGTNLLIGYPNGFEISATGTSGTEFGVNGTAGNPCPFADALTMNAITPLNLFTIQNGETIILSGNSDGLSLTGEAWTLDLSDESIVNMHARGATVSGGSTGSGSDFHDCEMGTCTIAPCSIVDCRFTSKTGGGFTMQTAGTYTFHACASGVSGNDAPVFTFPGAGDTFVSDRAGSGGRQYEGMSAGDLATIEGWGQFIEGTCSGGAVTIRGCLTKAGITNITLTDEARFDVDQIGDAVADEVITAAEHNIPNSLARKIRQLASVVIANDTAETSNSPGSNQIQLASAESSVDGTFDPGIVGLIGGTGAGQSRMVLEYKGSTRIATLNRDWKIAPDATTEYIMLASAGGLHVNEGLAQGGGPTSVTLNSLASSTDNLYNGQFVFLVSGPGQDQVGRVTAYNGTTKVAEIITTMNGWATQPTSATGYIMMPILDTVPTLLGSPVGANFSADIAAIKTDTGNLVSRITATLFSGITSLAQWLGLIAGKQVGNTTARTEVRATGAGSGTFDETTDSCEATVDLIIARTLLAAAYFDPATDNVAKVLTVNALASPERNAIADAVLLRDASNVEATAGDHSLCYVILAMSEADTTTNVGKVTVFKTDGTTEFVQKTLTTDADADPATGVK